MCMGGSPKAQPLPPTPPQAAVMSDPAVQQARKDSTSRVAESGLGSTQLTVNLGGSGGGGKKKLAGTAE